MNILFRLDCNDELGFGHMSRCSSIAKYMSEKYNSNIFFLSRNSIYQKNFSKINFIKKIINYRSEKFSTNNDLIETIKVIKKNNIDLVILDNYNCGIKWCDTIKNQNIKLVIIDDGLKKNYESNLYINYNSHRKSFDQKKLLGYKYFPIDERYSNAKHGKKKLTYDILINFGSGNFKNYLKILLNLISDLSFIKTIVIIGNNEEITVNKKVKIKFINKYTFIGNYIKNSKICIGAGGVNLVERLFLKKKNIVFSTARHQVNICQSLNKQNYIKYFGSIHLMKKKEVLERLKLEILKILNNKSKFKSLNKVDGNGIKRISKKIYNLY